MALKADVDLVFDFIKKRDWQQIEAVPKFRDVLTSLLVSVGVTELQKKVNVVGRNRRVVEKTFNDYSVGIDRLSELAEQNRKAILKLRK